MANPLRASVMYPPDRALFAPFRIDVPVEETLSEAASPLDLYAHIPFCETKCTYCDYETVPVSRYTERYVAALARELHAVADALPRGTEVAGFDVGGGTPGVLSSGEFETLIRAVDLRFALAPEFEISTETTPTLAAADPAKWRRIAAAGVARVSMGVQTTSDDELRRFNRAPHTADRARRGMDALRAAGFPIVNVDLMFALPGQTAESWEASLEEAFSLAPDVITIYDTVYKNRGIATQAGVAGDAPTPDRYGRLYDAAYSRLTGAGYRSRYGSVNFSRVPGRLGTSRYLEARILDGRDYAGVGLYASSLVHDTWRFGLRRFDAWLAADGALAAESLYRLPIRHGMAKFVLLALSYGYLDAARFERRFGVPLSNVFAEELDLLTTRGLFSAADDGWELTPGSFRQLPGIRGLFYPEDALELLDLPVVRGREGATTPRTAGSLRRS